MDSKLHLWKYLTNYKMMTKVFLIIPAMLSLVSITSCAQKQEESIESSVETSTQKEEFAMVEPHRYGGWYCPDNLYGFPPVDISNWENVPIIDRRLPTEEEAQSEASLIFVDTKKYPTAQAMDIDLPRLARVNNRYSNREDLIIVIQAFEIESDQIVGYRFLNGGNGSARLNEIEFLSDDEIKQVPQSGFVSLEIKIDGTQKEVWDILTNPGYATVLKASFDKTNKLDSEWRNGTNVNFKYPKAGNLTAEFGSLHFGNYYIQNDYDANMYNEKFLLIEDSATKTTTLKIACGPFSDNYQEQKDIITQWAKLVKEYTEGL